MKSVDYRTWIKARRSWANLRLAGLRLPDDLPAVFIPRMPVHATGSVRLARADTPARQALASRAASLIRSSPRKVRVKASCSGCAKRCQAVLEPRGTTFTQRMTVECAIDRPCPATVPTGSWKRRSKHRHHHTQDDDLARECRLRIAPQGRANLAIAAQRWRRRRIAPEPGTAYIAGLRLP